MKPQIPLKNGVAHKFHNAGRWLFLTQALLLARVNSEVSKFDLPKARHCTIPIMSKLRIMAFFMNSLPTRTTPWFGCTEPKIGVIGQKSVS